MNKHIASLKKANRMSSFTRLVIIIFLNVISFYYFTRLDLTSDNRFSLGQSTKSILDELDDVVYVKVYLDGDLPAGFRKLKQSTKELLDEMRLAGNHRIEYLFEDPLASGTVKEKQDIINQLIQKGLEPVNLEVVEKGEKIQKIIFPDAVISYKNKYIPVKLLQQQIGVSPETQLHNSITNLEFLITNTIKKLMSGEKKKIAFIGGHGELTSKETTDAANSLKQYYEVERIDLPKYKVGILDKFDLLIIAKPDTTFSELEKYKIDQFVVKGGKVLWLVESLLAEMDSLRQSGVATTLDYPLNLNDMFFKYGIRLNTNLVQDIQCHLIPITTTYGTPKNEFRPWPYYPVVFPETHHPVVNNLNAVWFRFANSIDTVGNKKIKKTILLRSSDKSRESYHIARISLGQVEDALNPSLYNKSNFNLAVLVEGKFNSLFKNRIPGQLLKGGEYGQFIEQGKKTKMIFISDGDVIANQISGVSDQYYPLGYDRYTQQTFGNKEFVMNCVDYLLDDAGIINLRSKQFKLRLLDRAKIENEKKKWQVINLTFPVVFIILFGLIYNYLRRKKNTRLPQKTK